MKPLLALATCAIVVGGCSIIYNQNNIGAPGDAPPAPDAPPPIDAPPDPTMLAVTDVAPSAVFAGQGSGSSRPAVLAIHGSNFTSGATVTFDNDRVHVLATQTANDSSWIAVQLEIDALPGSGSDGSGSAGSGSDGSGSDAGSGSAGCGSDFMGAPVAITVTEAGAAAPVTLTCALSLQQAPALIGSAGSTVTLDVATLDATTYSVIDLSKVAMLAFTDSSGMNKPVVFRSYSSVALPAINQIGAPGSGTSAGAGAQDGCAGGAGAGNGGCSTGLGGGNASTSSNGGGGGGGFVAVGNNGSPGANGGTMHGSDDLVTLTGNTSAGGGGGNAGGLGSSGGGGGGGGGVVEVWAGGTITVAGVNVSGGSGASGAALLGGILGLSSAGGGGGGTGGVIILRSDASTVSLGSGAKLITDGGGGGAGGGAGGAGGGGSPGRVRIDMQVGGDLGTLPMVTTTSATPPSLHRGAVFSTTTTAIVTTPTAPVNVLGQNHDVLSFYDRDGSGHIMSAGEPTFTFDLSGGGSAAAALVPGYNHLCATLNEGTAGDDLADTCIDLVYLP